MALEYYNHIDLNKNQLQNAVIHPLGSAPGSASEGQIYYDSTAGDKQVYVYTGNTGGWVALGGNKFDKIAVSGQTNVVADGTNDTLTFVAGSNVTITTNASSDSVTITSTDTVYTHPTHDGDDIDIDTGALTGATVISDLDFNITTDTEGHVTDANASVSTRNLTLANLGYTGATDATNTAAPAIENNSGTPVFASGSTKAEVLTLINVADGANNYTLPTAAANTLGGIKVGTRLSISSGTLSADNQVTTAAVKTALDSAIGSNTLTIGDTNTTTTFPGDIVVTGKTTTNNVEVVSTSNGVVFEGNAADANEGTLLAGTLSADRTYTLPNKSGTVAMTSDITGTNSGTNTGDQNLFSTIAVSGQSNVVADGTSDTLTFAAGSNVTITTAAGSDTVTISATDTNTNTQLATAAALIDVSEFTSGQTTATIEHSLSSKNLIVQMYDTSTGEVIFADIMHDDINTINVIFATIPSNDIRVVIIDAVHGVDDTSVTYS